MTCAYREAARNYPERVPQCKGAVRWRFRNLPRDFEVCDAHKNWLTSYNGCNSDYKEIPQSPGTGLATA
jgi:hypothetical protein